MFNNLQFFYGLESDYEKLTGNLDNCFYYTYTSVEKNNNGDIISIKGPYKLRLNDNLIYSSEKEDEITKLLTKDFSQYVLLTNASDENTQTLQTIKTPLNITNTVETQNLTVHGDFTADNYKYDSEKQTITIPCEIEFSGNSATLKNLIANGKATLNDVQINSGTAILKSLSFTTDASLGQLPTYRCVTDPNMYFNFKEGVLDIDKINANSITIQNTAVSTESSANAKFDTLQIGNLVLSDDGQGNLKITSVES